MNTDHLAPCDVLLIGQDTLPLADLLRALDHRVFPVSRLEVALHILKARCFDLLILAGAPADAGMTDTVLAIREMVEANAALATLVVWDRLGGETQALRAAGADRVVEGRLDDVKVAEMLGLRDDAPPPAEVIRLLQSTLGECLGELERTSLTPSRLADIAHRLKGSASSFSLPDLAEAARAAMKASLPDQDAAALHRRLVQETALALDIVRLRLKADDRLPPA
ncbi:MAG TPA: Hpt domain-containing protein [Candidatus Sulfotelmatobacter sp.]|jgi:HPt (histidine-containing phosphotransfer) domain-containing protein|nr:Hpt domain-containing protein [Candidatus Sulfotelmatobacter sp.]